jgi:hypothetical protein
LIEQNTPDPFPIPGYHYGNDPDDIFNGVLRSISPEIMKGLEGADSLQSQNHALLRLVYVLEQGKGETATSWMKYLDLIRS